jgi:hypothetical protein
MSMFLNFSYTIIERKAAHPSKDFAASFIDVYGDISRRAKGVFIEERYDVGPLPIDLPNRIISYSFMPMQEVR